MKDREIEFLLTLKDQLTAKWNEVSGKMKSGMKSMVDSFKSNWLAISASAYAAFEVIKTGFEWMEGWAKGEVMAGAFRATLKGMGLDAEAEFEKIRTAAAGMIDDGTLTEMSNRWISMGMDIRQMSDVLQLARIKARETGTDMQEAFTRLSEALALGKEKGLKAIGIAVDTTDAYKKYADSLGITVQQLTDVQKKQAVLNAALESGRKAAAGMDLATKTLNEQISTYKAKIEEVKDFAGQVFWRISMLAYGNIMGLWSAIMKIGYAFSILLEGIGSAADKVGVPIGAALRKIAKEMQDYAKETHDTFIGTLKAAVSSFGDADLAGPIVSSAESVTRATSDMFTKEKQSEETNAKRSVKLLSDTLDKKGIMIKQFLSGIQLQGVQEYELIRGLTDDMVEELSQRMNTIQSVMSGMLSVLQETFTNLFNGDVAEGIKGFLKGIVLILIDTVQAFVLAAAAAAWAKGVMTFGFSTFSDLPMVAAATVGLQLLRALVAEKFHSGGVVPKMGESSYVNAPASSEFPILVRGGETIRTESQEAGIQRALAGGSGTMVNIHVNGPVADARAFKEIIQRGMRETGITDAAQYFRNSRSNLVLQS